MQEEDNKNLAGKQFFDPDARFLLANERTFLAWVRTSLAVLAGGIALTKLGHNSKTQDVVGIAVIILGSLVALVGYMRFKSADKAIRQGKLPTIGPEPLIQVIGIIVIAMGLIIAHLLGIW